MKNRHSATLRGRLLTAGFIPGQSGDTEGTLLFDPANPEQTKAAISEAGIRIRIPASPELYCCTLSPPGTSPAAGRLGAKARQEKLTPEERRAIAREAIRARWLKAKKKKTST